MIGAASRRALMRAAALATDATYITTGARPVIARGAMRPAARTFAARPDIPSVIGEAKEGVVGDMPDILDQATGLERAEIDHPDLFKHNEVLRGAFGTSENPVKIQSNFDARIVGCTGKAAPDDHDLVWLSVRKGEPSVCSVCGQVFVLDPL